MKIIYNKDIPREQQIFNNIITYTNKAIRITADALPRIKNVFKTNVARLYEINKNSIYFDIITINNMKVIYPYCSSDEKNLNILPPDLIELKVSTSENGDIYIDKIIPTINIIHPLEFAKKIYSSELIHTKFTTNTSNIKYAENFIKYYSTVIYKSNIYNINDFEFNPEQLQCTFQNDEITFIYNEYPNISPLNSKYGRDILLTQFEENSIEFWKNKCIIKRQS